MKNLSAQKAELSKHRDVLNESVADLTQQNNLLVSELERVEGDKGEGVMEIQALRELSNSKLSELEREQRRIERVEKDQAELAQHVAAQVEVLSKQNSTFDIQRERTALIEGQYKEQKRTLTSLATTEETLKVDLANAERVLQTETAQKEAAVAKNNDFKAQIRSAQEVVRLRKLELEKIKRTLADQTRAKRLDEVKYQETVATKDGLVGEARDLIKTIDRVHAYAQQDEMRINQLLHERDLLNKSVIKADSKTKGQMEKVQIYDNAAHSSKEEVARWKAKVGTGLKRAEELDKRRQKCGIELSLTNHRYFQTVDKIKQADNKMTELKKMLQELNGKLNEQKELYQSARGERNQYSRILTESQDEIAEMRRKFKVMYQQIEQLTEEVGEKDEALRNEIGDYDMYF